MEKTRHKKIHKVVSKEFAKVLDNIKQERIKLGVDKIKEVKPDWRITLGITRHPGFKIIVNDLIVGELKNE